MAENTDIKEAPVDKSKLFAIGPWPWILIMLSWLGGGIILTVMYGALVFVGYFVLFIGWLSKSVNIVKEDERAKLIFLGKIIKGIIGSGLTLTVYPLEILRRYPTGVKQLKMGTAGIQTKREVVEIKNEAGTNVLEKVTIPQIILPVTPIFNYQWPWNDEDLTAAIRFAPNPDDPDALIDKLEEPLLDIVRTAGGHKNYEWIMQNRVPFAEEVTRFLKEHKDLSAMINLFRLQNVTVAFKHIDVPELVKTGQSTEAAARHTGAADRIREREKRIGIGEGEKSIREALAAVLVDEKFKNIGITLEAMITLREMAKEGKTTYALVPQSVYGALSRALGGPAEQMIGGLSEQDFKDLLEMAKKLKGDAK